MTDDRSFLVEALKRAAASYKSLQREKTVLLAEPSDPRVLDPLVASIEKCEAYKAVAGKIIYSANSGVVIQASTLAINAVYRAQRSAEDTAEWLIRLLTTSSATGVLKAAIWGLSVSKDVKISEQARVMPFAALPASKMKDRVTHKAMKPYGNFVWLARNFYDEPTAAYVMRLEEFPYIEDTDAPFRVYNLALGEAQADWALLEGVSAGQPIAVGYWFEYEDHALDIADWENSLSWSLPEVSPRIDKVTSVDGTALEANLAAFSKLPEDFRRNLLRSMKRFALSQCRMEDIDRILDLVLAYEIITTGGDGDNAPASWKVSARPAQIIGGALASRQETRNKLSALYKLRSSATHGGTIKSADKAVIDAGCQIFRELLRSLLLLGKKPDWRSIELGPP